MKKINLILLAFLLMRLSSVAQTDTSKKENQLTWHTDLIKANELSKAANKPLFVLFTGSDWCGWCKKLQANVFSKPEFIAWAKKNVILVEADFPRSKALSPELTQQNNNLQQALQVRGYPTIWVFFLNKGKENAQFEIAALGSLGYPQGAEPGKEQVKFLQDADLVLKNKEGK